MEKKSSLELCSGFYSMHGSSSMADNVGEALLREASEVKFLDRLTMNGRVTTLEAAGEPVHRLVSGGKRKHRRERRGKRRSVSSPVAFQKRATEHAESSRGLPAS